MNAYSEFITFDLYLRFISDRTELLQVRMANQLYIYFRSINKVVNSIFRSF